MHFTLDITWAGCAARAGWAMNWGKSKQIVPFRSCIVFRETPAQLRALNLIFQLNGVTFFHPNAHTHTPAANKVCIFWPSNWHWGILQNPQNAAGEIKHSAGKIKNKINIQTQDGKNKKIEKNRVQLWAIAFVFVYRKHKHFAARWGKYF